MADDQRTVAIPLIEERLVTAKREVETGKVRVRTLVEERETLVEEELSRAFVEVDRVPMHREVDEVPAVREEAGVTIIPVVQEVLVVEKKLILTEEVYIRRKTAVERHAQPVILRTQRAVVEREGSSGDPVTS